MSPQQAVNAYKKYIQPFKGRAYLGAPAVTNGPAGLPWLKEFFRLCTGCQIDFLPVHWYDSATNDAWFKLYMSQAYAATGSLKLKLWVTEVYTSCPYVAIPNANHHSSTALAPLPRRPTSSAA